MRRLRPTSTRRLRRPLNHIKPLAEQVVVEVVESSGEADCLGRLRLAQLVVVDPAEMNSGKEGLRITDRAGCAWAGQRSGFDVQFGGDELGGEVERRVT